MAILEACISCNCLSASMIQRFAETNRKASFIQTDFLKQAAQDIARLIALSNTLQEWNISPEILASDQVLDKARVAECAKDLITAVLNCVSSQHKKYDIKMVDLLLPSDPDINEFFSFMDKYVKAASILSMEGSASIDQKNFMKYAFDFCLDDISRPYQQTLRAKRDALIQASISWSESQQNQAVSPVFPVSENTNTEELPQCGESTMSELPEAEVPQGVPVGEAEENADEENADEENADEENINEENTDIYDLFLSILNEDPPCPEDNKVPSADVTTQPEENELPGTDVTVQPQPVQEPEQTDWQDKAAEATDPCPTGVSAGPEEFTGGEEQIDDDPRPVDAAPREPAFQSVENTFMLSETVNEESLPPVTAVKERPDEAANKPAPKPNDPPRVALHEEYVKLVRQCIEDLQQKSFQERDDYSDISQMCWNLLFQGEFMLAKELADTFQNWCPCVNATVIALAGSGLWMPVTDKSTMTQFLLHQPLVRWEQLPKDERTIAVLSAIPIAHCSLEVKLDHEMIDELPECFHGWIGDFVQLRSRLTYLDCAAIEECRVYLMRLKGLRSIAEEADKCLQIMSNPHLPYEAANRALIALCGQDAPIGALHEIMAAVPLEDQAYGTENPDIEELYRRGRTYIPERKNAGRAIDERLLSSVIEAGQKKSGYMKEIVGSSRSKMQQIIEKYLNTANEWLELIKAPCRYDDHSPASQFMAESVRTYLYHRPQLLQYIQTLPQESMLKPVYIQFLSVMDYLCSEREALPEGCKTHQRHMYRLCAVPTLDIQKDELGYYRYTCKEPLERLRFLSQVMPRSEKSVAACIDEFARQDDFSGCELLFELLSPEEFEKVSRRFEGKKARRLEQLAKDAAQMRKQLYQISVYAGWLGIEYLSALSNLARIEQLLKHPEDVSLLCSLVKLCQQSVNALTNRFCDILREQVSTLRPEHVYDGWDKKLNAMIDEGQYTTVIELTTHSDITDADIQREDFFCERYFEPSIYDQKERSLVEPSRILVEKLKNTVKQSNSYGGFNFNKVPGTMGTARVELIGQWYKVKGLLQNLKYNWIAENDPVYGCLRDIMKSLGWSEVSLKNRKFREDGTRKYIQFDMYFSTIYSREQCPIPQFGSRSGGRIRMLCIYGAIHAPDNLYHLFESTSEKIPMIILFFGVMTRTRRLELYHLALEKQASFLVVDDIVICSICESRDTRLLRWMYTLTVPFSVQDMYTSSLGVVFPEMFYGRAAAKKDLGLGGAVCAVYGGRQLGKTALLKNIQYESHQPQSGYYVYYIGLPRGPVDNPELLLTRYILNALKADIDALDKSYSSVELLLEDIKNWLDQDETRRLLLLLDESDQFLMSDSTQSFRVTGCINNLMTTTDLRFKVVFAGLHNVYRMISSPNHPLAHHGKPISIGPLMADELQDAINLIRQPFEIMGYRFASLDLIIQILAETNYYPSLIQVFCKKLHDYLLSPKVWSRRSRNLPVIIHLEDINAVLDDLELKQSISDRFMWTLELDHRYKAIALSIALDAGSSVRRDPSNNIVEGYDMHWISSAVERWPDLFGHLPSIDEIRGLCDELVQLGILRNVSGDSYTLRTVNILNMLGTPENILSKMAELEYKRHDYQTMFSAGLYRGLFRGQELLGKCYPLTHQQLHSIFDNGGVKLVLGTNALGLDLIESCLRDFLVPDTNNPTVGDFYQQRAYTLRVYLEDFPTLDELGDDSTVSLILPKCHWEPEQLQEYAQELSGMEVRPLLIVLCDEVKSHQITVETQPDFNHIPMIKLATWDYEAIQFWLSELVPLPMTEVLNILERLQGWPAAMYQFSRLLSAQEPERVIVKEILDQTVETLSSEQALNAMLPGENVDSLVRPILHIFADFQTDISCTDMHKLLQDEEQFQGGPQYVERVMAWMADQKLLNREKAPALGEKDRPDKYYTMNPLIMELWKKEFPQA